ncbi:hypothetical protein AD998_06375 [bacterium 336/3]|jgi:hypothetical protein|nr:hypothetical protein AD998_06375 [bacterium 336/3]
MKKLIVLALIFLPNLIQAQCVMCKSVSESSGQGNGINSAILYMAFFPYLLLSALGYVWYKNYKKNKDAKKNKTASHHSL